MKDKFSIGDYVKIKGLKKSRGVITYIRSGDSTEATKYRVRDKMSDFAHFWSEGSLTKVNKRRARK